MAFSDIVGHQRQLETLRAGLMNGRLHHAYLFWGPEGIGKRTAAMAFAMALHCEDGPPSDSCGQCRSCVSIAGGSYPDVHRVELKSQKKEISVEQVRQLQHHLSLRSFSGKGKVAIVDPAHLLNYHGQNSLLKTLEEPSEGSTIVLISKSRGGLLPTILSRCFQLAFVAPSSELVAELLVRKKGLSADQARLLAAVSMGSPGEALASDPALYLERRRAWLERLSALAPGDYRAVLELAGDAAGDREQALYFLRCMEAWYRDVLMVQITGSTDRIRNLDMDEKIRRRADFSTPERTVSLLEEIDRAAREIQRNYNSRMALEHLLMRTGRAIG